MTRLEFLIKIWYVYEEMNERKDLFTKRLIKDINKKMSKTQKAQKEAQETRSYIKFFKINIPNCQ